MDLFQSVFIILSFMLARAAYKDDAKSRKIQNLIDINESHREIWAEVFSHPHLNRIRLKSADLRKEPITHEERRMVQLIILHIFTAFEARRLGQITPLQGMERDIVGFFSNSIPHEVWKEAKQYQNRQFVTYIDQIIGE